jgi:RNA polymerase sigma factor (sigma-70 family)
MASTRTATHIAEESDEDLLIQMSLKDSQPAQAREAWRKFHERHHDYIARQAYKRLESYLRNRYTGAALIEMAKDLATDTIERAFLRAETFDLKGQRSLSDIRRQVRAWLGVIAHNIVCDWLRGRNHAAGDEALEDIPEDTAEYSEPDNAEFHNCVAEAFEQLSDKERLVLHAFLSFFDAGKGTARLSNEESAALAAELGMTPISLRQTRHRALKRLRTIIETKCKAHAPTTFPW